MTEDQKKLLETWKENLAIQYIDDGKIINMFTVESVEALMSAAKAEQRENIKKYIEENKITDAQHQAMERSELYDGIRIGSDKASDRIIEYLNQSVSRSDYEDDLDPNRM